MQIDCSHGNSSKQHIKQLEVGKDIVSLGILFVLEPGTDIAEAEQLARVRPTSQMIMGVMIESNINEGKQAIPRGSRRAQVRRQRHRRVHLARADYPSSGPAPRGVQKRREAVKRKSQGE